MLIRCEKCATLYELDDNMLPPGGAPVQCSRCQYVFTAFPERRAEGGAAMSAPPREGGARREATPPDGAAGRAPAGEAGTTATRSTPDLGGEHLGGERADAGQDAEGLGDYGPSALAGEAEPGASGEDVTAPGPAGPALASAGEAAVDGAAEPSASAPAEPGGARPIAAAAAGGTRPRSAAPRAGDGRSQLRRVNDGAGAEDEPKFTADGRPIRKVPFPDAADALSPRTTTARPSLQTAAPKGGERARLPWLVPVVVAVILAFAALVAWRLITTRAAGEDAGRQPVEGHSSLLHGGRPQGGPGGAPTPGGPSVLAARDGARDGKTRSHSSSPVATWSVLRTGSGSIPATS